MREPHEMVTASRMQNGANSLETIYLVTKKIFEFLLMFTFRALGVENPRGGAVVLYIYYSMMHHTSHLVNFYIVYNIERLMMR